MVPRFLPGDNAQSGLGSAGGNLALDGQIMDHRPAEVVG